jgi:hypothetical protein
MAIGGPIEDIQNHTLIKLQRLTAENELCGAGANAPRY